MRTELEMKIAAAITVDPALKDLSDLMYELASVRFAVLCPSDGAWDLVAPDGDIGRPKFCQLIKSTSDGGKHCRMCHILMAIAACSGGPREQQCHSGAYVFVSPIPDDITGKCSAVLSTCVFREGKFEDSWEDIKKRCSNLGVDTKELRKAFKEMPVLSDQQLAIGRKLMGVVGGMLTEIKARITAEADLQEARRSRRGEENVQEILKKQLQQMSTKASVVRAESERKQCDDSPILIETVAEMVTRQPSQPFTVGEIAAAARITPNYFSTLFNKYKGQSFSDFVAEKRISMAKELLLDLTLNIAEVARRVGYEDPGYFARRFKQKAGMSARQWREQALRG
jgi:AraC-like DNA-binding protein/ligand-binding sensor protein